MICFYDCSLYFSQSMSASESPDWNVHFVVAEPLMSEFDSKLSLGLPAFDQSKNLV